jgi:serine/threonine protein kinase
MGTANCGALARVHEREVTHMDLKPSNILISAEINALLSDVSGIGGVTRDYLAPEMLDIPDPLAESKESRVYNDIWVLGKIFMEMGDASSNDIEKQQLKRIAQDATADDPTLRPSLYDIISILTNY